MSREPSLRLAIDIDGVLANLVSEFLPILNRRFDRNLTPEDITQYAFEEVAQVPAEEMNALLRSLIGTGFYARLPLVTGAREALLRLLPHAHLHLVTSRSADVEAETRAWLEANQIPYHALTFRRRAAKHLPEDRFDVIIDDDREAALAAAAHADRVFLLDYPYNREGAPLPVNCIRVRNWDEILAQLTVDEGEREG